MKTRHFLSLGMLLGMLLISQRMLPEDGVLTLRILSYNIQHGAGSDNVLNLDRQADVIVNAAADLVGLQEVDSFVKRSNYVDEANYLAEKTGMHATFGPAIPLSGGKYGVAILSKEKPLTVTNTPLPGAEKRTLLVCEFENYVFACTHLDLQEDNRLASLDIIRSEAKRWDKPFYICGDWNDEPSSALIKDLKTDFVFLNNLINGSSAYTFPANNPKIIIDYVATYGKVVKRIRRRQVLNEPLASDHRPVLVEVLMDLPSAMKRILKRQKNSREAYDLTGKRLPEGRLAQGIYIVDGKKKINL